ncbi:MAG: hypothetical protein ACK5FF_01830 [Planctomyces sp.]|jgi:hypothetical protein
MAKRRRKSISREQADVGPPAVEAVVARKVVAETVRRATALQVTVLRVSVLRVVVEVSARLVVREATDRPAEVLAARQLQNSIRRLVI